MRIDIAAQTDIGRRKKKNEDFYGVFREDTPDLKLFRSGALLCVADGLGGHTGGEIASKLAVSASIRDHRETFVRLRFGEGNASIRFWASDLTTEYVRFNSEYTT